MDDLESKLRELGKAIMADYDASTGWMPAHSLAEDAIEIAREAFVIGLAQGRAEQEAETVTPSTPLARALEEVITTAHGDDFDECLTNAVYSAARLALEAAARVAEDFDTSGPGHPEYVADAIRALAADLGGKGGER